MRKVWLILIILFLLVGIATASYLAYSMYTASSTPNPGNPGPPPVKRTVNEDNFTAEISDINSLLNAIGASSLHNPPLSGEKPSIEIKLEERTFCSEVSKAQIQTSLTSCEQEDLFISSSNREVAKMINSNSIIGAFKLSLSEGKTSFEMKASELKLFSKGYLELYNKINPSSQ